MCLRLTRAFVGIALSTTTAAASLSFCFWARPARAQKPALPPPFLAGLEDRSVLPAAAGPLNKAFNRAATEFDVPRALLVTIAYAETRFDDRGTLPSADAHRHSDDSGYGLMHLVRNRQTNTLQMAATLLRVSQHTLKISPGQNIRGGAAILRAYADAEKLSAADRKDLARWYPLVARYANAQSDQAARLYADEVYRLLTAGVSGAAPSGEIITQPAQEVQAQKGRYEDVVLPRSPDYRAPAPDAPAAPAPLLGSAARTPDYSSALWVPANSGNYTAASRPSTYPINYVVIHFTQGSYGSAINWFQNPSSNVSAHYVIRSSDGQITQMVQEKDYAWHAGNRTYNQQSIGIEHEGFVSQPSWYTDVMYRSSAALTRSLCLKYGIPMDRAHIIGHNEVPGATHTDPGPYWNWTYYLQLVRQETGWSAIVDNAATGFSASASWGVSSYSSQRNGGDYRYASPQAISDAAWFQFNLPATGRYEVYVWYPANSGYNASTPFVVETTNGPVSVSVNQQVGGGQWVSLGLFSLAAGERNVVGVSRWTNTPGFVIADAVKIVQR